MGGHCGHWESWASPFPWGGISLTLCEALFPPFLVGGRRGVDQTPPLLTLGWKRMCWWTCGVTDALLHHYWGQLSAIQLPGSPFPARGCSLVKPGGGVPYKAEHFCFPVPSEPGPWRWAGLLGRGMGYRLYQASLMRGDNVSLECGCFEGSHSTCC